MELIENIERIMKEKGITVYKLTKETEIKDSTYRSWKKGSQPTAEKIEIIARYLAVSPNELFGYNDTGDKDQPKTNLSENEQEMLKYFRKLPEREQIKEIGRIEDKAAAFTEKEISFNSTRIG